MTNVMPAAKRHPESPLSSQISGTRPLDIALVHAADQGGGAERSVLTLHQTLRRLGHRSRLFVGSKLTNEPEVYEIERKRTIPGLLRLTRWLENDFGLQQLYAPWFRGLHQQIGAADVLHLHTLWGGTYGYADLRGLVRLSRRYPTIMTLRDGFMLTGHCACPIGCERWRTGCGACPDLKRAPAIPRDMTAMNWRRKRTALARSPLHVTTVSRWLKTQVDASPLFAGKPVSVVYNSIDETIFVPGSRSAARAALGLPQDRFLVLLAGQSVEGVRQGVARQAISALNALVDADVTALLIGHSSEQVARELKLPTVTLPYQATAEAMCRCYQAADVTLVTSEYETFGRVAAESQMCGVPVVSFATGGLAEVVRDHVTGRLVATGDWQGAARALRELREQPAMRQRLGEQGARDAQVRFHRDVICREYVDLYRQVIRAGTEQACRRPE